MSGRCDNRDSPLHTEASPLFMSCRSLLRPVLSKRGSPKHDANEQCVKKAMHWAAMVLNDRQTDRQRAHLSLIDTHLLSSSSKAQ